jgi:hypothetical protein
MQRALHQIAAVVSLAAVIVIAGAATSWALSPDDVIKMTKDGQADDVIIQRICTDAEAWDLTSDDIKYLGDKGVSDDVIQALIDPKAASEKYGYQLGPEQQNQGQDEDQNPSSDQSQLPSTDSTPYVFTPGYYYGPLARAYFYDPFFYPYMYSPGFAFSIGFGWPAFYASYYYPYYYGYYGYPYFAYQHGSYYYGGHYCGSGYSNYRGYYTSGGHPYGGGTTAWHDWSGTSGGHMLTAGGALESRTRSGQGFAVRQPGGGQVVRSSSSTSLGGLMNSETRAGVINRGAWVRSGQGAVAGGMSGAGASSYGGARVLRGGQLSAGGSHSWGRSRMVVGGGAASGQSMRSYMSAPTRSYGNYGYRGYGYGAGGRGYGSPMSSGMSRGYGNMGRAATGRMGQGFGRVGGMGRMQGGGRGR